MILFQDFPGKKLVNLNNFYIPSNQLIIIILKLFGIFSTEVDFQGTTVSYFRFGKVDMVIRPICS